MKKLLVYTIICMFLCTSLYAHDIAQPPVLKDDKALVDYLKTIADNYNTPTITTTAPNGNIIGEKGHLIIYNNSGTFELWVNKDGSKTWSKVGP